MHVMFLSATGQIGGAETSLLEILGALRQAEPSWTLRLVMPSAGPLELRAASLGVQTRVLPFPQRVARLGEAGAAGRSGRGRLAAQMFLAAGPAFSYVARLRTELRSFAPDVVHSNGLKQHLLASWAAEGRALVWHLHDYLGSRPLTARLLRESGGRCAVAIANSESVASDARATLGATPRVVVIYNGIDLARFSPFGDRIDLDARAGLPPAADGTVRIGLLGTFARWKGHGVLLNALARLPRTTPFRAYLIGDAVYQTDASQYSRQELASEVDRLGLAGLVGFCGFVDRADRALRSLDIVVHASTAPEPFGLVIAEAMACGRAVVASAAGGAMEIVAPEKNALGHAAGDADALAAQLLRLLGDGELRARLGQSGRTTAEQRFGAARLAGELAPIYRQLAPNA